MDDSSFTKHYTQILPPPSGSSSDYVLEAVTS